MSTDSPQAILQMAITLKEASSGSAALVGILTDQSIMSSLLSIGWSFTGLYLKCPHIVRTQKDTASGKTKIRVLEAQEQDMYPFDNIKLKVVVFPLMMFAAVPKFLNISLFFSSE